MRKRCAIKLLANKRGKKAKDMLALTQVNDPFYIGSETQHIAGYWARDLYRLLGQPGKVHIRRLHYFALTQRQHRKPSGKIYCNTSADWKFLCDACKFARYLEILPYDIFIDRRSVPKLLAGSAIAGFDSEQQWHRLVSKIIEKLCRTQLKLMLAKLMPLHIEIWVEKSTAADLIGPIADKYNVNIVTTLGEISLTAVWEFVKRIRDYRKPVRIFYISDFDPAGENMPISVARKIEFLTRRYKLSRKISVKLRPLMLSRQQCKEFELPGIPLPENKNRKFAFTRYNGRVTTELHALEIARPGYIGRIVDDELSNYIDTCKITEAAKSAERVLKKVICEIQQRITKQAELAATIKMLQKVISTSGTGWECNGPWLLDSERNYLSQLATYQLHRLR